MRLFRLLLVSLGMLLVSSSAGIASEPGPCLVMLVPGAFAEGDGGAAFFLSSKEYFAEYREFFAARGCRVKTAQFPPDATVEERGIVLRDQLERFRKENGAAGAFLVAHSQGGLDVRFALKTLKLQGVRAVATIGTPHLGTPLADWTVRHRDGRSVLYWFLRLGGYDLEALRFLGEFQASFLEKFSKHFELMPGVPFASAKGLCRTGCHRSLRLLQWWVGLGPGDGISPAERQGIGMDLGEYDLDHISEVGVDAPKKEVRKRLLVRIWEFFLAGK